MMKSIMSLSIAVALVVGADAPAQAQQPGSPRRATPTNSGQVAIPPELLALLRAGPNGGEALTAGVADILKKNPAMAMAVVALAKQGNPEQKAAIAQGYLRALAALKDVDPRQAQALRAALAEADETLAAMVAALESQNYAEAGGHGSTFFSSGGGGFSTGPSGAGFSVSPQ
ncbi:MAG TPA: hypothetical protein VEH76_12755 [Methylocystis sp.]|nr:hypothetical protein [Methylocystis sp.]